jgi:hypothetical protein
LAFSGAYVFAFAGALTKLDHAKGWASMLAFVALIVALFAGAVWFGTLVLLLASAVSPSLPIVMLIVVLAVIGVLSRRK